MGNLTDSETCENLDDIPQKVLNYLLRQECLRTELGYYLLSTVDPSIYTTDHHCVSFYLLSTSENDQELL